MPDYLISKNANIGKNVNIGKGVIIHDNVSIGDNTFIGAYSIIGEPTADYYKASHAHNFKPTVIGANSIIRSFTTIYENVTIGAHFQSGHHAIIREDSIIGHNSSFGSCSELPGKARIGNYVRIHSKVMLSENNIIDDYVWIYPFVVITNVKHPPTSPHLTTHIKKYAQVFAQSTLLPGICIGENAIVAAGALVKEDVGDERLVAGRPAKDIKSVRAIKDENGAAVYPWKDHLKTYRGYDFQENDKS